MEHMCQVSLPCLIQINLIAPALLLDPDRIFLAFFLLLTIELLLSGKLLLRHLLGSGDLLSKPPGLVNLLLHAGVLTVEQCDPTLQCCNVLLSFPLGSDQLAISRFPSTSRMLARCE